MEILYGIGVLGFTALMIEVVAVIIIRKKL